MKIEDYRDQLLVEAFLDYSEFISKEAISKGNSEFVDSLRDLLFRYYLSLSYEQKVSITNNVSKKVVERTKNLSADMKMNMSPEECQSFARDLMKSFYVVK